MNWGMLAAGIVIAWIGGSLLVDGDNYLTRWLGLILATLVAGSLICIGCGIPEMAGWVDLDSEKCSQYVYMEGAWKCVPWDQGG